MFHIVLVLNWPQLSPSLGVNVWKATIVQRSCSGLLKQDIVLTSLRVGPFKILCLLTKHVPSAPLCQPGCSTPSLSRNALLTDFFFQASYPPKQSCDEIPNKHSIGDRGMYLGRKAVLSVGNKAKQILLCCAAADRIHSITWSPTVQSRRLNIEDSFLPHRPAIQCSQMFI